MRKVDLYKGISCCIVSVICLILANLNNFKFIYMIIFTDFI